MTEDKIHQIEINQVKMKGDIEHIRDRIDNGLGKTITQIFVMLNEMTPQVKENSYWVKIIKETTIWAARISIVVGCLGAIGLYFFFMHKNM